jgi:hypothetical protein
MERPVKRSIKKSPRKFSDNIQGYNISEKEFKKLPIKNMLKYILHNNQNNDDFNTYFYKKLEKINEKKDTKELMKSFGKSYKRVGKNRRKSRKNRKNQN